MSWTRDVDIRDFEKLAPLVLDEGEHVIKVVSEPKTPITTKYGKRLVFIVEKVGEKQRYAWFVPYDLSATRGSVLGQLKGLTDQNGGTLQGNTLSVIVKGQGAKKRYTLTPLREQASETTCPSCRAPIAPEVKFCGQCGGKVG